MWQLLLLVVIAVYLFIGYWWSKKKAWRPIIWLAEQPAISVCSNGIFLNKPMPLKDYYQMTVHPAVKGLQFWGWALGFAGGIIYGLIFCIMFLIPVIIIYRRGIVGIGKLIGNNSTPATTS